MKNKIKEIEKIVKKELSCSAHNLDHVYRVYNLSLTLAKGIKVDQEVLKAAVLLHDIARVREDNDNTGKTDHAMLGAEMAEKILLKLSFPSDKIEHIKDCIRTHRYRADNKPKTLEAKILFDADKLDAIGAIGVSRAFVWVGSNQANIYNDIDLKEYIKKNIDKSGRIKCKNQHSANIEFETKLKYIVKKLYTKKGKEIGKERIKYLKDFFKRLEKEIKGKI